MKSGTGNCSQICHIVRLRQMLRKWLNKARMSSSMATNNRIPSDVPAGHVAVCVGTSCRRFVVRATHLNHPAFKNLLVKAEEEYGFTNGNGPLTIPCDESDFEDAIRFISGHHQRTRFVDDSQSCSSHVGGRNKLVDFWTESRPLLHGVADKTIW